MTQSTYESLSSHSCFYHGMVLLSMLCQPHKTEYLQVSKHRKPPTRSGLWRLSRNTGYVLDTPKPWRSAVPNNWADIIIWQWTSRLCNVDFFINGLVCIACETYLIRRCWKVSPSHDSVATLLTPDQRSTVQPAKSMGFALPRGPCHGCLICKYIPGVCPQAFHYG